MIAATKLGREMKRRHQAGAFGIEILHPGLADNAGDSGIGALGRIDHARVGEGTVVRMHPHKDDEILTYLRGGRVRHQDTEGHLEEISATRLMMMNAGRSFQHEETVIEGPLTGLQIFLRPHAPDLDPMVQFHDFGTAHSANEWRLIAGPRDAPLTVRGEVQVHDMRLDAGRMTTLPIPPWPEATLLLYLFDGRITADSTALDPGEALMVSADAAIAADRTSDLVLFTIDRNAPVFRGGMFSGNLIGA